MPFLPSLDATLAHVADVPDLQATVKPFVELVAQSADEEHIEHTYRFKDIGAAGADTIRHKVCHELIPDCGGASAGGETAAGTEVDVRVNGASILTAPVQVGGMNAGTPQDLVFGNVIAPIAPGSVIEYVLTAGLGPVVEAQVNVQYRKTKRVRPPLTPLEFVRPPHK